LKDLIDRKVHLVTDQRLTKGRPLLEIVEAAINGGVSVVQLREKELCARDFHSEGMALKGLLKDRDILLIINDRVDIAMALDADGVHLGQTDLPVWAARELMGPDKIIGLSVEQLKHATDDAAHYADYLGVSPIFVTSTKPELQKGWGLGGLRKLRSATETPLVAIGSINAHNAAAVIEAGADSIAVVSAITFADDPEASARELIAQVAVGKQRRSA
jgi:thiamine-phosphate pyrophosphorylase